MAKKLETQTGAILAMHLFAGVGAVTMIVFAAGLHRRLRARAGDGLAATVAFSGLLGTAVVTVLGSGLDTEFLSGSGTRRSWSTRATPALQPLGRHDPVGVGAGGPGRCRGLRGLPRRRRAALDRHRRARVGGLTLLLGISPLQYMAGMTGPIWLLATALAFTFGDRAFRRGE